MPPQASACSDIIYILYPSFMGHKYGSRTTFARLASRTCVLHEPCKCPVIASLEARIPALHRLPSILKRKKLLQ